LVSGKRVSTVILVTFRGSFLEGGWKSWWPGYGLGFKISFVLLVLGEEYREDVLAVRATDPGSGLFDEGIIDLEPCLALVAGYDHLRFRVSIPNGRGALKGKEPLILSFSGP
jgi:hypothetical protein